MADRNSIFYTPRGVAIQVGRELGRGGEGAVYEIEDQPDQVAKIYLAPIDSRKTAKLQVMVSQRTEALTKLAAWPADLIVGPKRQVRGLMMRKIVGFHAIHELYTPKTRLQEFPRANWAFLIHTATNVARAFAVMHAHSVVIGDVNQGNILVNEAAVSALIDCDSFQITSNGDRFLCDVGVSTYTPPELQGKNLSTIVRTTNHDNFGLALLIFHLLLMGRHPFVGRYLGSDEMPVERAIRECRFAFSADKNARQMEPPPNSLALSDLPSYIAVLFEQAFSPSAICNSSRPNALSWIESLRTLSHELLVCQHNSSHCFYRGLSKCPWCRIEDGSAVAFFLRFHLVESEVGFDINSVWSRITSIPSPGPAPPLEIPQGGTVVVPIAEARSAGRRRKGIATLGFGVVAAGIALCVLLEMSAGGAFWTIAVVLWVASRVWKHAAKAPKFQAEYSAATARYDSIKHRWRQEASDAPFISKRRELDAMKNEFDSLPRLRQDRIQTLEKNRKGIQLQKWLDRYYIRDATIPGIGPGRKAVLSSYGIDTAADLSWHALQNVHGIGPRFGSSLMQWRDAIASRFVFNSSLGVDRSEIAKLDQEIAGRASSLRQKLSNGIPELQLVRERTLLARANLRTAALEASQALMQAEANFKAC